LEKNNMEKKNIDEKDIMEYLQTYDTFALEMFVYNKAVLNEFQVSHGGIYFDPNTKKTRQFDLQATFVMRTYRIALAIECKSLKKSCPLIVSRMKRAKDESFHEYIRSKYPDSGRSIPNFYNNCVVSLEWDKTVYKLGEYVGKSMDQIERKDQNKFSSKDSDVYDKWMQATTSASTLVESSYDLSRSRDACISSIIIPALVVQDETLWVVDYSDDGTVFGEPKQVNEVEYFINTEYENPYNPVNPKYHMSHLHIFTKKGISDQLDKIAHNERYWGFLFYDFPMIR